MKLYVEHNGQLYLATEGIETYDLSKPMAKASVCHDITATIDSLRADEEEAPIRN